MLSTLYYHYYNSSSFFAFRIYGEKIRQIVLIFQATALVSGDVQNLKEKHHLKDHCEIILSPIACYRRVWGTDANIYGPAARIQASRHVPTTRKIKSFHIDSSTLRHPTLWPSA